MTNAFYGKAVQFEEQKATKWKYGSHGAATNAYLVEMRECVQQGSSTEDEEDLGDYEEFGRWVRSLPLGSDFDGESSGTEDATSVMWPQGRGKPADDR